MATRVASPDFVGRAAELAELEAALERAAAAQPAVALVGGESGVGKSRLTAELVARALDRGARVLAGDCLDLGEAELPYAPIVAALRELERDEVEEIVGPAAAGLAPLLSQLGDGDGGPTSGALAQGRLFELLLALIGGLARDDAPVLLVIEDLHWADRSTRDFVAFLIRNARRQRIALVATYRTDELHRRHPLRGFLAEAERAPAVTRVSLPRFTREELRTQIAGILGHRPDARLVDDLFARAEGNAFYTEELVAAGGPGGRLPENVRDTLMVRIEALSPDAQSVLRVAAAAGPRVRHQLLERASGLPDGTLLGGLREAVVRHVLVHDPATEAYAFRHALLREALLDDLLPGERGPLHATLARALAYDPSLSASGSGVAAELAYHWAAAHDLPAAFTASCEAGAEAERLAAFAEANAHYERAAELWDAVPEERRAAGPSRVQLLRRAADMSYVAGDLDRAVALTRRAVGLVDAAAEPMTAAVLHQRLSRFLWHNGLSTEALEAIRAAVALLPDDGPGTERAQVLGAEGHLLMLLGRGDEATARCEAALEVARAAGARAEEGKILTTLGTAMSLRGDDATATIARLEEGRRIAVEQRDLEELTRSYINLAQTLDNYGRLEEAAEVTREGIAMTAREGISIANGLLAGELASRLLRLGRWAEAAQVVEDALDRPSAGLNRAAVLSVRGHLDALTGDATCAVRNVEEAAWQQRGAVGAMWTAPISLARAEAALWDRHPQDARAVVAAEIASWDAGEQDLFAHAPVLAAGVRAEADLAEHARSAGDSAAEAEALERTGSLLAELRTQLAAPAGARMPEPQLSGAEGEAEAERAAGRSNAANWRALAERWQAFGSPFPAAYARWREAEAELAAGGGRAGVAAALTAARATAAELGARPLRDEAESLARRARITLGATTEQAPEEAVADEGVAERLGLTSRELEVLRRLAAGDSNREIGQTLYISHKTVSVHVSRILTKLDARTRVEAAGVAQRLGLLSDDTA
jgi:DNA-binding CsgD family transcriptional regulator